MRGWPAPMTCSSRCTAAAAHAAPVPVHKAVAKQSNPRSLRMPYAIHLGARTWPRTSTSSKTAGRAGGATSSNVAAASSSRFICSTVMAACRNLRRAGSRATGFNCALLRHQAPTIQDIRCRQTLHEGRTRRHGKSRPWRACSRGCAAGIAQGRWPPALPRPAQTRRSSCSTAAAPEVRE